MNAKETTKLLNRLDACKTAKEWAHGKDLAEIWATCERGDWMLWLAFRMMNTEGWGDLRNLTAAKVECAKLVKHLMTDQRSIDALDVAERFVRDDASRDELNAAAADADAAAADAADAYAADAYTAADAAAYAADAYAYAAADAAAAAYAAAAAADAYTAADAAAAYAYTAADAAAAYADARLDTLKKCADICRRVLVTPLNIHSK